MILKLKKGNIHVIEARTFYQSIKGLMGEKNISYGMLFPKCNAIHTFFMKENIDVVVLNEQNQVIYIYRNLPKNQVVRIQGEAKKTSILELPKDTSKYINMGSVLFFEDEDVV